MKMASTQRARSPRAKDFMTKGILKIAFENGQNWLPQSFNLYVTEVDEVYLAGSDGKHRLERILRLNDYQDNIIAVPIGDFLKVVLSGEVLSGGVIEVIRYGFRPIMEHGVQRDLMIIADAKVIFRDRAIQSLSSQFNSIVLSPKLARVPQPAELHVPDSAADLPVEKGYTPAEGPSKLSAESNIFSPSGRARPVIMRPTAKAFNPTEAGPGSGFGARPAVAAMPARLPPAIPQVHKGPEVALQQVDAKTGRPVLEIMHQAPQTTRASGIVKPGQVHRSSGTAPGPMPLPALTATGIAVSGSSAAGAVIRDVSIAKVSTKPAAPPFRAM